MSIISRLRPAVAVVVPLLVLAACGGGGGSNDPAPTPAAAQDLKGLRILLTNDDSIQAALPNNSDGLGLYEVRRALCAAGAEVVVIAPWAVQSGRGTAVTNSGVLHLGSKPRPAGYENDCAGPTKDLVFGMCVDAAPCSEKSPGATPGDTVRFALRGGLKQLAGWDKPDLVVSGTNSGLNVASSVNDSGTVAAAIAAVEDDVPAIAISTAGTSARVYDVKNYRATADWTAAFIMGLRGENLLNQHEFALNISYPNIAEGAKAEKAVWASVGAGMTAHHGYARQPDGGYKIELSACKDLPECEETRADADAPAVQKDRRIAVVPIDWDRTYGHPVDDRTTLDKVKAYVDDRAPAPVN